MEAHNLNTQQTYRYPLKSHLFHIGYIIVFLLLLFWKLVDDKSTNLLTSIIVIVLGIYNFVFILSYQVKMSPFGISVRKWWNEVFIAWQDIQSVQLDWERNVLRLYPTPKSYIEVGIQTLGYDDIWEKLHAKRPDLFTAMVIHKFHGEVLAYIVVESSVWIFLGLLWLISGDKSAFFGFVPLLMGLGGLIYVCRSMLSVELGEADLIITHTLSTKRIPKADIVEIKKGLGVQTRSGKFIALGKVREGQAALYEYLLKWWRAGRRQS